jgi:hypothetical protein
MFLQFRLSCAAMNNTGATALTNVIYIVVIVMGSWGGSLNSFDGFPSLSFYDLCLMNNTDSETTSWQKQLTVFFFCCCTYNIYTSLREQCLFINSLFGLVWLHLSALDLRQLCGCGQLNSASSTNSVWPLARYSRITVCHIVRVQCRLIQIINQSVTGFTPCDVMQAEVIHSTDMQLYSVFWKQVHAVRRFVAANIWRAGARCSIVVKVLCYKPEGRWFDTRWGEFLNLPNPSGRTRLWGLLSL